MSKSQSWSEGGLPAIQFNPAHQNPTTASNSKEGNVSSKLKTSQSDHGGLKVNSNNNNSLIDFGEDLRRRRREHADMKLTRVSVLEAFDPLRMDDDDDDDVMDEQRISETNDKGYKKLIS